MFVLFSLPMQWITQRFFRPILRIPVKGWIKRTLNRKPDVESNHDTSNEVLRDTVLHVNFLPSFIVYLSGLSAFVHPQEDI